MNVLTVIAALFVFVAGPIWLAVYLRRTRPDRIRLGVLLCLLFPLFGQFYKQGAATAVIAVFGCGLLLQLLAVPAGLIWLLTGVVSALLMQHRLRRSVG